MPTGGMSSPPFHSRRQEGGTQGLLPRITEAWECYTLSIPLTSLMGKSGVCMGAERTRFWPITGEVHAPPRLAGPGPREEALSFLLSVSPRRIYPVSREDGY